MAKMKISGSAGVRAEEVARIAREMMREVYTGEVEMIDRGVKGWLVKSGSEEVTVKTPMSAGIEINTDFANEIETSVMEKVAKMISPDAIINYEGKGENDVMRAARGNMRQERKSIIDESGNFDEREDREREERLSQMESGGGRNTGALAEILDRDKVVMTFPGHKDITDSVEGDVLVLMKRDSAGQPARVEMSITADRFSLRSGEVDNLVDSFRKQLEQFEE